MNSPAQNAVKPHLPALLLCLAWLLHCGAVQAGGTQGESFAGTARTAAGLADCVGPCGVAAGHASGHGQAGPVLTSPPTLFNLGGSPDSATGSADVPDAGANFEALTQVQEPGRLSLATGSALEPLAQSLPAASPGALAGEESVVPRPTLGLVLLAALGLVALGVQARVRKGKRRR